MSALNQYNQLQMVTNLEKMMIERLTLFRMRNENKLPGRILVYRDGVSEVGCFVRFWCLLKLSVIIQGQFQIVVGEELPAIKAAFKKFATAKAPYQPKLTIVICVSVFHVALYSPFPSFRRVNATTRGSILQNPRTRTMAVIPKRALSLTVV